MLKIWKCDLNDYANPLRRGEEDSHSASLPSLTGKTERFERKRECLQMSRWLEWMILSRCDGNHIISRPEKVHQVKDQVSRARTSSCYITFAGERFRPTIYLPHTWAGTNKRSINTAYLLQNWVLSRHTPKPCCGSHLQWWEWWRVRLIPVQRRRESFFS